MSTKAKSRRNSDLDLWPTEDAVEAMFEGQLAAAAAVKSQIHAITRAAEEAAEKLSESSGRLAYAGAGTSGRLAVLDGTELEPTFGWSRDRLIYLMAGGMEALAGAVENAEDDEEAARERVRTTNLGPDDVLIALSASGTTPFTIAALRETHASGALTIGIASSANSPLLLAAKHPIFLDTGAELVSGSTRMKAGTAQKIALNLLSTTIMLRLGHVYDGLMIDMRISNRKLRMRAIDMVSEIAGVDEDRAEAALAIANDNIRIATLVAMGVDPDEADDLLQSCRNDLRAAIRSCRTQSQ